MSDRLTEIEARANAARHDEWRWDSLLEADELGDAGRMHISVPGRPRDPPSIFALLAHKDVVWLVAQVRERDAEIARLRAEVAGKAGAANVWRRDPWGWSRNYGAGRAALVLAGAPVKIILYEDGKHILTGTLHASMSDDAARRRCDEHARLEGWPVEVAGEAEAADA